MLKERTKSLKVSNFAYMKRHLSLCLLLVLVALCVARVQARIVVLDDVNGDAQVDVTDVNIAIDALLAGEDCRAVEDVIAAILTGHSDTVRTGHDLVWNYGALPEVHLTVSLDEWNRLLALYDADRLTTEYVHARVQFITGADTLTVDDAGLRIRGNGSRRRPEGSAGQMHEKVNTKWHPTGWGINLRKYHKNEMHTLQGVRKVWLRYFYHDPTYVRELYCYRLFEQCGVWTAPRDTYCRVWVGVEGDAREAYYGVYSLLEPIDADYVEQRREQFGFHDGYLWKAGQGIANLKSTADWLFVADTEDATATEYAYQLKTRTDELDNATAQLKHFITQLNTLGDEDFAEWTESVCDVELLLRTYAVMVAVANWDDYWNNGNNYYLYFNTTQVAGDYQVFFIPYDLDNTLGSSRRVGAITDAARQDPLHWWQDEKNPLIARLLNIPKCRKYYKKCLKDIVGEENGLFHHTHSMTRIAQWQQWIAPYVPSDTDKDNVLKDEPSKLGNTPQYRLLDPDPEVNFFKVREKAITQSVD